MRPYIFPQAVAITALVGAGIFGFAQSFSESTPSDLARLLPAALLVVGVITAAIYFQKWKSNTTIDPAAPWSKQGVVIFYLGVLIFMCGAGLMTSAFGKGAMLTPHEGLLGFWAATLGSGVLMLGRFVGRGSL